MPEMAQIGNQGASAFYGEPISVYTRAQALEDGVLAAVPDALAREAGFVWPVAITDNLFNTLSVPTYADNHPNVVGQTYEGRLWDVLYMAAHRVRQLKKQHHLPNVDQGPTDRVYFEVLVTDYATGEQILHRLICAMSAEAPDGGPCITIMFPSDD